MLGGRYHITPVAALSGGSSPPPPPPAYTCGAVDFAISAKLTNAAFVVPDSPLGLISLWVFPQSSDFQACLIQDNGSGAYWLIQVGVLSNSVVGTFWDGATNSKHFDFECPANLTYNAWNNILMAVDTNHAAGMKVGKVTINAVSQTVTVNYDADGPFDIGWGVSGEDVEINGLPDVEGSADLYIATGQYLDVSTAPNIAKFISAGKPIDLGSDGSTPTGTAPAIFLHIDHGGTPSAFATNKGTGGNFAITGSLSLAPSSPSD